MQLTVIIAIVVPVVVTSAAVATGVTLGLQAAAAKKKRCDGVCDPSVLSCGVSCATNSNCTGQRCDGVGEECIDGVCAVRHACDSSGGCVPSPSGPFVGPTCTCVGVGADGTTCGVVGNSGTFASIHACNARDADYACVPGEGTCERTLGASTGWASAAQCKCFECQTDTMVCSATLETAPVNGIDAEGCARCGRWGCSPTGECERQVNGVWDDPSDCACGQCADGKCAAAVGGGGGAYTSVSACEADGGARCLSPNLGWTCDAFAGNDSRCKQTVSSSSASIGGATEDTCRCWSCVGDAPGPTSQCEFSTEAGVFASRQSCFDDPDRKCGWLYQCV